MSYAFYPGCALSASALPYGMSAREVTRVLEMDMPELEDWNCCGASCFQALNEVSHVSLSGRNLALAERVGRKDLVTPCSGCFEALERANQHLIEDSLVKRQAEAALSEAGLSYGGSVNVRHLLDVMVKDVGVEAIKERVTQPLTGLKVACYYGCLLTRPPAVARNANPEYPVALDNLMTALGAEPVDWSFKTECCGASYAVARPEVVAKLTTRILDNARAVGADLVVAACPLCQTNLDAYQGEHTPSGGHGETIPIVYFTELMGLAFGLTPAALGMGKHFRDPMPALRSHSLVN